jgi:multiple sugar transport system permease protein
MSSWIGDRVKRSASRWTRLALLIVGFVVFAGPFVWMLSTSLKLPANQYTQSIVPSPLSFVNYAKLFTSAPFLLKEVLNSLQVSVLSTVGQVLTCAMAGFMFAVFRFRGKSLLFGLLIATFVIPPQVTLIPNFIIFSRIGLVGTKAPLWITAFMGGAFGTFLLRQYFSTVPVELAEAARMDGATIPRIFSAIYFPLAKPALSALAILTFTGSWNELIRPLVYLPSDQRLTTVTVGLSLYQAQYTGQWSFLMACAVVSILPIFVVFLFAQKQIIEGTAMTGLK